MTSDHTPASASEHQELINIALGLMDAPKGANLVSEVANMLRKLEEMQAKADDYDRLAELARNRRIALDKFSLSSPGSQVDGGEPASVQFDYLLNRFERASQAEEPAKQGYAEHRKALYAYVRGLENAASPKGTSGSEPHPEDIEGNLNQSWLADAARWRMLPAFLEEHQIDYVKLLRDIDSAIAAQAEGGEQS